MHLAQKPTNRWRDGINEIYMPLNFFSGPAIKNIKMFSSYLTDRVRTIIFCGTIASGSRFHSIVCDSGGKEGGNRDSRGTWTVYGKWITIIFLVGYGASMWGSVCLHASHRIIDVGCKVGIPQERPDAAPNLHHP